MPDAGDGDAGREVADGGDDAGPIDPMDDAGPPLDGSTECPPTILPAGSSDLLWLVDTTASWTRHSERFDGAVDAILASAERWPSGEQALATFPRFAGAELACERGAHETLDLDWGGTRDEIGDVIDARVFEGGSSLAPALEGAIAIARERSAANGARPVSIILVTDASPSTDEACGSDDWAAVAAIAARGFDDGRRGGVRVHVVSVIARAVAPSHFAFLADIATAGGGFLAVVNGSRVDVRNAAFQAIEDISTRTDVCTREIEGGEMPEAIELRFPDGSVRTAQRVDGSAACERVRSGFYLDDPAEPRTLTLCSGPAGIGGFCQVMMAMSDTLGEPEVTAPESCER